MTSEDSVNEYLKVDMEIWPDAPIGYKRLIDQKQKSAWTAFVCREGATLIGIVMAWIDEDGDGIIEDVFVREPWRKQGIAKHLLSQALLYLKENSSKKYDMNENFKLFSTCDAQKKTVNDF